MKKLSIVILTAVLATGLVQAEESAKKSKPNVLLIMTDDMGYGDPQCFNPQSRLAPLRLIVWPGDV